MSTDEGWGSLTCDWKPDNITPKAFMNSSYIKTLNFLKNL